MEQDGWDRARLIPVSGISGSQEQERRGTSALLAVIDSVKEFGRALTVPLGAPAGAIATYIEVTFKLGDKHVRPDGLIRVVRGAKEWTALVEVKTGRNVLRAEQVDAYLEVARQQGFDAVLTISNQLSCAPGKHPVTVDRRKMKKVNLYHMSWSEVHTEALIQQANKSVTDPDQAWILSEFIRYLGHPSSGAMDFDDMGPSWVTVREAARAGTLTPNDKGAAEIADQFGQLVSFVAMQLSRQLGVGVVPVISSAEARDPNHGVQSAAAALSETGCLHGAIRVPHAIGPIEITADLRAGQVRCAVAVGSPRTGRPTTRVNWLVRQLREAPGDLCIEPVAAWQRSRGAAKSLIQVREDSKILIEDPKRDLRSFKLSLASEMGKKRGQGHGSFVSSVVGTVDRFYAEIVEHLKPWTQAPPKVKDEESPTSDESTTRDTAQTHDIQAGAEQLAARSALAASAS